MLKIFMLRQLWRWCGGMFIIPDKPCPPYKINKNNNNPKP